MLAPSPIGHQGVDLGHGDLFTDSGQVQVDRGGHQVAVAHVLLDLPQVDARFEQMRGVAVTVMPSSA
jgi:hypothetical protein